MSPFAPPRTDVAPPPAEPTWNPTGTLAFLRGVFRRPLPADDPSPIGATGGGKTTRTWVAASVASLVFIFLLVVAVSQAVGKQWGFSVEQVMLHGHVAAAACGFLSGASASLYRVEVASFGSVVTRPIFGKEGEAAPVLVQAAFGLLLLLAVLLVAAPNLLDKMASFKAGDVEAHFETGAGEIRGAPVNFLDAQRKVTLDGWIDFRLLKAGEARDGYEHAEGNAREALYRSAGAPFWRIAAAQDLLDQPLVPLFKILACFEEADRIKTLQDDDDLAAFALGMAKIIKEDFGKTPPSQVDQLDALQHLSDDLKVHEIEWVRSVVGTSGKRPREKKCQTVQEEAKASAGSPTDGREAAEPHADLTAFKAQVKGRTHIWDPYIVAAVADLVAFVQDHRERANFLEVVKQGLLVSGGCDLDTAASDDGPAPAGPEDCRMPLPGLINFRASLVEAKIKSEGPWPIDDEVNDLVATLDDLRGILDSASLRRATAGLVVEELPPDREKRDLQDQVQSLYRLNYLTDLSTGLELFYQRALSGERLSGSNLARWREWLDDTRRIMSVLGYVSNGDDRQLDPDEERLWRNAHDRFLRSNASPVLQDIATSAALSSVLLPAQTGRPSSRDCLDARSMLNFATSQLDVFFLGDGVDEQGAYKGFLAQVGNRIDAVCS